MTSYTLAFDPGNTTGWAAFRNEDGATMNMGQVTFEDMPVFLASQAGKGVTRIIYEEYVLYRKKAMQQSGSQMITSQVIGMIRLWAAQHGIECIKQRADIKPAALKWSQIKMPSNHAETHKWDAWLHGFYYLKNAGVLKSALQLQVEAENAASK